MFTLFQLIFICFVEWKGIPKKSENPVAQNGGAVSEAAHSEQTSPVAKTLPVQMPVPIPAPITVPPPQVRLCLFFLS